MDYQHENRDNHLVYAVSMRKPHQPGQVSIVLFHAGTEAAAREVFNDLANTAPELEKSLSVAGPDVAFRSNAIFDLKTGLPPLLGAFMRCHQLSPLVELRYGPTAGVFSNILWADFCRPPEKQMLGTAGFVPPSTEPGGYKNPVLAL